MRILPCFLLAVAIAACSPAESQPNGSGGETSSGGSGSGASDGTGGLGGEGSGGSGGGGGTGSASTGGEPGALPTEVLAMIDSGDSVIGPSLFSDGYIYFSTMKYEDEFSTVETWTLWRVPQAGGTPEIIVPEGADSFVRLDADTSHLYYVRSGGETDSLYRASLTGDFSTTEELVGETPPVASEYSLLTAQTDTQFIAIYSRSGSFTVQSYDKATLELVYEVEPQEEEPGHVWDVRQERDAVFFYTSSHFLYSVSFADGSLAHLGTFPELCEVEGPDETRGGWLGTCTSVTNEASTCRFPAEDCTLVEISDSGETTVLTEDIEVPEIATRGVAGGKLYGFRDHNDVTFSLDALLVFEPAQANPLEFPLPASEWLFEVDGNYVYYATGNTIARARYSDEVIDLPEPDCVEAEPIECDSLDTDECSTVPGCAITQGCSGVGTSCSELGEDCADLGCTPGDTIYDPCSGEPTCADQASIATCNAFGCTWNGCGGTPTPCADITIEDCSSAPHCELVD